MDIYINGKNARTQWGVVTTSSTLDSLLMPPAVKEYVSNTSRLENGTRYDISNVKLAERDLTLEIQMIADNPDQFYSRHQNFCAELSKGSFDLYIDDRPDIVYHLLYRSCQQYTQFVRGIATLALKVTEPDPSNRAVTESDSDNE